MMYQESYYNSWGGSELEATVSKQKMAHFERHLNRTRRQALSGSILDVGCAKGHFVDLAITHGYDAYGVEISSYSGTIAGDKVGKDRIHIGTIEAAAFEGKKFDVITMFDLLEHVPDLHETLTTVFSLLKTGGLVYVVTPDAGSLSHLAMGKHWGHYKREHLYYFNRSSLEQLLRKHEFTYVESGSSPKTLSLEYLFQQFETYPVPILTQVAKFFRQLLPSRVKDRTLTLPSGKLYFMARKSGAGS
ncbi:MAG: class I SAM-dependent methyltransferase [bacterium]|nr:class I SAM-dependent methyltransferase [bacterium]